MNGGSIPYHLRPLKSIDRYAFIDLLNLVNKFYNIKDYIYVSLGGHSFEDFKYMHYQFGNTNMISLESDGNVNKRQVFNLPFDCIDPTNDTTGEFIAKFSKSRNQDKSYIIWLDYTSAFELGLQMNECSDLIGKLLEGDILKVTFNAHANAIRKKGKGRSNNEKFDILKERVGDNPLALKNSLCVSEAQYPSTIVDIFKYYVTTALSPRKNLEFLPLAIFKYADGQTMLTITGIIIDKTNRGKFLNTTDIISWRLYSSGWTSPKNINIPSFTIREKLLIDSMIVNKSEEEIIESLGFYYSEDENENKELIKNYKSLYRYVWHLSRVSM